MPKKTNVVEIVKKHLVENDFNGLCLEVDTCACTLDNLMECGFPDIENCVPCKIN
jgi:hypothetical protein